MNAVTKLPVLDDPSQTPYLGWFHDGATPPFRVHYQDQKKKHLLTFGNPGAMKTMGLCVPNLAKLRRSIIVLDPKGQNAAITARHRAKKMGRVIIINPYGVLTRLGQHMESTKWNPVAQIDPANNFEADARLIAAAMRDGIAHGKGEFFETNMENYFTVFLMWERLTRGPSATLRDVVTTLSRPADRLLSQLRKMAASNNFAINILSNHILGRLADEKSQTTSIQDTVSTLIKNCFFLADDKIAADMETAEPIDYISMHREITTIYVILPIKRVRQQEKWLRIFVDLTVSALLEELGEPPTLPPILFMCDEFGNMGHREEIVNALFVSRDSRLQIWPFLQSLGQLQKNYPKDWTSFLAGSGAVTTFNTGDPETAELFSKLFGNREVQMVSESMNGMHPLLGALPLKGVTTSRSTSIQVHPLIAAADMRNLGENIMAGYVEPCPDPVQMIVPGYWQFPKLAADLDPNPYYFG